MFAPATVALAFAASALANPFITSPVQSTTFNAGQQATVSWQDNGNAPSLSQFGKATFGIYVGNAIQQTLLQTIATVDVSAVSSFTFTPDATIGPNSGDYFIRATSLSAMDPKSPQFPAEAFSSMFTLAGMSGTFNATIQSEINGQSTAPIGGTTASSSAASTASSSASSTALPSSMSMSMSSSSGPSMTKTTSSSSSSPTSTGTTSSNGGVAVKPAMATGLVMLVATLAGASLF